MFNLLKNNKEKAVSTAFESEIKRRLGEYNQALSLINKAIKIENKNPDFYMTRAMIKYALKDFKNALKDIDKAININPSFNFYYIHRILIKKSLNMPLEEDFKYIEENNKLNNIDSLYNYLADNELEQKNIKNAIQYLARALKFNPKNEKLLLKKINLERSINDIENAYNDVKSLLICDNNNAEYYHILANIEMNMKKFDKALSSADKSIDLNDNIDGYYALRARIKIEKQDFQSALEDLKKASDIDKTNSSYQEMQKILLSKIK